MRRYKFLLKKATKIAIKFVKKPKTITFNKNKRRLTCKNANIFLLLPLINTTKCLQTKNVKKRQL